MITQKLHALISAVCPIDGVSIGVPANKSTWRIDYSPIATVAQRAAAQNIINNYNYNSEQAIFDAAIATDIIDSTNARADSAIKTLQSMTPSQARLWVQNNINTLNDAKTLLGTMAAILCVLSRKL